MAVSGLLNREMYGPPVRPPQPKFELKAAFSGSVDWTDSTGPDRYRRAIYTLWRRSAPYPSMVTFDKSSREVCEVSRSTTNTPLQALVTRRSAESLRLAPGVPTVAHVKATAMRAFPAP